MVNKYFIGSHISERKFRQIVRFFCLDIEAKKTAELTGISRQSINKIYAAIRQRIVDICSVPIQPTIGEFELDESYFGAHRVRGIRGRGARGKIIVFGIFKRPNTIYTYIVNNCSTETLIPNSSRHSRISACSFVSPSSTFPPTNSHKRALDLWAGLWQIKNLSLSHISAATTSVISNINSYHVYRYLNCTAYVRKISNNFFKC